MSRPDMELENNWNWKGGRRKRRRGAIMVKMPSHPLADCDGYVYEHTLVAELKLGRHLLPEEIVHHKDGNAANNEPDNILVFENQSDHITFHNMLTAMRECGHPDWRKCVHCHQYDDPANMTITTNHRAYHKACAAKYQRDRNRW